MVISDTSRKVSPRQIQLDERPVRSAWDFMTQIEKYALDYKQQHRVLDRQQQSSPENWNRVTHLNQADYSIEGHHQHIKFR